MHKNKTKRKEKDLECQLSIKAIVGHLSSKQSHIFELSHGIPKFSSYLYVAIESIPSIPKSFVQFTFPSSVRATISRIILWLNHSFLLEYESSQPEINIGFISLRDGRYLALQFTSDNKAKISTENITLAGDIIQDLSQYLGVTLPSIYLPPDGAFLGFFA